MPVHDLRQLVVRGNVTLTWHGRTPGRTVCDIVGGSDGALRGWGGEGKGGGLHGGVKMVLTSREKERRVARTGAVVGTAGVLDNEIGIGEAGRRERTGGEALERSENVLN